MENEEIKNIESIEAEVVAEVAPEAVVEAPVEIVDGAEIVSEEVVA